MIKQEDKELVLALNALQNLVNQRNNEHIVDEIVRYKSKGSLDKFTLYRINRKLREMEKALY